MMSVKINVSHFSGERQSLQHSIELVYRYEKQHRKEQAGCIIEHNVGLRLEEAEQVI